MMPEAVSVSVVLGVLTLTGWLLAERWRLRERLRAAQLQVAAAAEAEAAAVRLLRLSAQELRAIGVRLRGQADSMGARPKGIGLDGVPTGAQTGGLGALSGQLFDIADALQDGVLHSGVVQIGTLHGGLREETGDAPEAPETGERLLREEVVDLGHELAQATAQAQTLLAPGRRHWRLPALAAPMLVWVDRRALRHVLGRVLADAVRNTGQDDWIDIALRIEGDEMVLVVEDEGGGVPALEASPDGEAAADSRGIGLRLTLARSLMEAHGGRLEVEAMPRVGSRISLVFPATRRRAERLPVV